jgi:hypothetical protein
MVIMMILKMLISCFNEMSFPYFEDYLMTKANLRVR